MLEELEQLLKLAGDIEANPKKYAHACDGKKLATLFYEASTRTRLCFVKERKPVNRISMHHPVVPHAKKLCLENSGQTMKTIEKLSCLLYYVQRLFTKILSLFKEGFMRHLMSPLDFSVEDF